MKQLDAVGIIQQRLRKVMSDPTMSMTLSCIAGTILNHAMFHIMHPELLERPGGVMESSVREGR